MMKLEVLFLIALVAIMGCERVELLPGADERQIEYVTEIAYTHVLQVGPTREFTTIRQAAGAAGDSTLIEVDAGTYKGDAVTTVWEQDELYIRAVGGEVILDANGKAQAGKGIWEIAGGNIKVEGFTFINARVSDKNGAGIRFNKGRLTVDNCKFLHSECGILTANSGGTLIVHHTEFGYLGYGDGRSHNLYVGQIDTFLMTGSYSHHANNGHLVKCRARFGLLAYNRITNENDDSYNASYEVDLPDGGTHILVGNIIQQSEKSPNTSIIAFNEENGHWNENALYLSHNTILNSKATSSPLFVPASRLPASGVVMVNNLFSENIQNLAANFLSVDKGNLTYKKSDLNADYLPSARLSESTKDKLEPDIDNYLPNKLTSAGFSLIPASEYHHPCRSIPLTAPPAIAGASQQSF
ncbi:MAG: hypothetical protein LBL58_04580 [Tannerellaceae bacterium]|jgi:hypothetical protein|nr:hypothetical protein [Tannerellaceae bacterium]